MKILYLLIDQGSLKWSLYRMPHRFLLGAGSIQNIGMTSSSIEFNYCGEQLQTQAPVTSHLQGLSTILEELILFGLIDGPHDIRAVGHQLKNDRLKNRKPSFVSPNRVNVYADDTQKQVTLYLQDKLPAALQVFSFSETFDSYELEKNPLMVTNEVFELVGAGGS